MQFVICAVIAVFFPFATWKHLLLWSLSSIGKVMFYTHIVAGFVYMWKHSHSTNLDRLRFRPRRRYQGPESTLRGFSQGSSVNSSHQNVIDLWLRLPFSFLSSQRNSTEAYTKQILFEHFLYKILRLLFTLNFSTLKYLKYNDASTLN